MDLASELCQTVGDKLFFTWHIFLEVGKTQDMPSKIWQTLEDALTIYIYQFSKKNTNTKHLRQGNKKKGFVSRRMYNIQTMPVATQFATHTAACTTSKHTTYIYTHSIRCDRTCGYNPHRPSARAELPYQLEAA